MRVQPSPVYKHHESVPYLGQHSCLNVKGKKGGISHHILMWNTDRRHNLPRCGYLADGHNLYREGAFVVVRAGVNIVGDQTLRRLCPDKEENWGGNYYSRLLAVKCFFLPTGAC